MRDSIKLLLALILITMVFTPFIAYPIYQIEPSILGTGVWLPLVLIFLAGLIIYTKKKRYADKLKISKTALIFFSVFILLTLSNFLRVEHVIWPDNEYYFYGFPLTWIRHQTSTITGAVDVWSVVTINLLINILCWISIFILAALIIHRYSIRRQKLNSQLRRE